MGKYLGMCMFQGGGFSEGFQGLVGVFVRAVCISLGCSLICQIRCRMRLSSWSSSADCEHVEISSGWRRKIIPTFLLVISSANFWAPCGHVCLNRLMLRWRLWAKFPACECWCATCAKKSNEIQQPRTHFSFVSLCFYELLWIIKCFVCFFHVKPFVLLFLRFYIFLVKWRLLKLLKRVYVGSDDY